MDRLIENIKVYTLLSEPEIQLLQDAVDKKIYQKNEIFFTEGKISDEIYFVTKGCVRLFYNVDGNNKTAFFYTEGQFICAGESYTFNIPAIENYQAIEQTEIFVFRKSQIETLLKEVPKFEVIARIATENELITCQKVIASFVTKSAEERYIDLLNTKGELFQRVPQQYIASFLGVSPETLSRIKTRVFNKEKSS
ncbi:Crp/Fnr family transcriptional regulator [Sphingobacterium alkalisoli]|uniref:Crp/Fnr family transcriptional regulator n=1 Tax=Sphingobacterium alkalisoli TaxID=1874115 RepID=A0A4U0GUE8_9SPHI|nr:Crp/Fnr family transcriptional regulator [Sphingobacterium alkalisoli]TJY62506.1 Crp/Fnr family transcriptional regulator [Sphingobacterium alkalisoli]